MKIFKFIAVIGLLFQTYISHTQGFIKKGDIFIEASTAGSTVYSVSLRVTELDTDGGFGFIEPGSSQIGVILPTGFQGVVQTVGAGVWTSSGPFQDDDGTNATLFSPNVIIALSTTNIGSTIDLFSFSLQDGSCSEDIQVALGLGLFDGVDANTILNAGLFLPTRNFDVYSGTFSSNLTGFCSVATPVELTTFDVEKHLNSQSMLTWATSSELNNDRFEVERSTDGLNFGMIGEVQGNGTTSIAQEYSFTDSKPAVGTNYYRLRQVDFDGAFEYTDIKSVHFGDVQQAFSVFPNPASDELQISTPFIGNQAVDILIFNNQGQLMKQQTFGANNRHTLNITDLANGLYLIQATSGNERHEQSVVVHRP